MNLSMLRAIQLVAQSVVRKPSIVVLTLMVLSSCAAIIQKSDFDTDDQFKLDQDFAYCDSRSKDYAARFNYYNPAMLQCMNARGNQLKASK